MSERGQCVSGEPGDLSQQCAGYASKGCSLKPTLRCHNSVRKLLSPLSGCLITCHTKCEYTVVTRAPMLKPRTRCFNRMIRVGVIHHDHFGCLPTFGPQRGRSKAPRWIQCALVHLPHLLDTATDSRSHVYFLNHSRQFGLFPRVLTNDAIATHFSPNSAWHPASCWPGLREQTTSGSSCPPRPR